MEKSLLKRAVINNASLEIRNLSLQRGDRLLLRNLNLIVGAGDALELRGANGSGKTTLLRAIAGLHKPKSGTIHFNSLSGADNSDYIGILSHQDAIKPNETIGRQLEFWADIFGESKDQFEPIAKKLKIIHLLGHLGSYLSAGQKRRVAIARIMLSRKPIWLLDEPAAPLDKDGRTILGTILQEHLDMGGIVIAAVHDELPLKKSKILQIDDFRGAN